MVCSELLDEHEALRTVAKTMNEIIDLRSDTTTRPTAGMRQAIAEAEVGDAVLGDDPTLLRLEALCAELLGMEAAIYVPSGSMANTIALRTHCQPGAEFLCEANCHLYHYEQGAFAALGNLIPRLVDTDDATIRVEAVEGMIRPSNEHFAQTQLVCFENTHNRWGGRIADQEAMVQTCDWARQKGLATHLDGARIWNAAEATGRSVAELAEPFDSVSACFSKGLGAPVGSILAGTKSFIEIASRNRKLFGGAMRQTGMIAAAAIYALEHHRERLSDDHDKARRLGEAVRTIEGFRIRGNQIDTNMLIVEMDSPHAHEYVAQLRQSHVWCFDISPTAFRLVTHLDVSDEQIDRACEILVQVAESYRLQATS